MSQVSPGGLKQDDVLCVCVSVCVSVSVCVVVFFHILHDLLVDRWLVSPPDKLRQCTGLR